MCLVLLSVFSLIQLYSRVSYILGIYFLLNIGTGILKTEEGPDKL